jgi:hypothetical protein
MASNVGVTARQKDRQRVGRTDISLAAHRMDGLEAAEDEALGVEWNFT